MLETVLVIAVVVAMCAFFAGGLVTVLVGLEEALAEKLVHTSGSGPQAVAH